MVIQGQEAASMRKRRRLTVEEKLEILEAARTTSIDIACETFGVSRTSVYAWSNLESRFREQPLTIKRMPRASNTLSDVAQHSSNGETTALQAPPIGNPATTTAAAPQSDSIRRVLVGVQGEDGGFTNMAAQSIFEHLRARNGFPAFQVTGYPQVVHALEALSKHETDFMVVTSEALLSRTTPVVLNRMMSLGLEVVGEVTAEDHVSVCALPGTNLRTADCVMSDWCVLSRFEEYILHLEGVHKQTIYRHVTWDSATACRIIREEHAEKTLVICSPKAADANGLSVLVERIPGTPVLSRYAVIACRATSIRPFDGLIGRENGASSGISWLMTLQSVTRPNWMEVVRALGLLSINLDYFSIRSDSDDHVGSGHSCVIAFRSTSATVTERTINHVLATVSVTVCYIGKYTTHVMRDL